MAAIIAQLTRAKRERAKKRTYETNKVESLLPTTLKVLNIYCLTNQCMYELDPFDAHFDPEKHNKYLVR